jgi:hypothetical protein
MKSINFLRRRPITVFVRIINLANFAVHLLVFLSLFVSGPIGRPPSLSYVIAWNWVVYGAGWVLAGMCLVYWLTFARVANVYNRAQVTFSAMTLLVLPLMLTIYFAIKTFVLHM